MTSICRQCGREISHPPCKRPTYCSRRCQYRSQASRQAGLAPRAAVEARITQGKVRSRQQIADTFGELSVREIALIRLVYWRGYNRGYQRAWRKTQREQAA